MRDDCKLLACLAGTESSCLPTKAASFLFALQLDHQGCLRPIIEQACGCSVVPIGSKLFACLAGTRRSCLPTQARRLPLCFAISPTKPSSKRAAAVRCEADANCLPVWPALKGAACRQWLPPSSLLCSDAIIRDRRPTIEQACGCAAMPSECKLFACLVGTRRSCSPRSCLPTKAAAFLFASQWSHHQGCLRPTIEQACGCSVVRGGCKLFACLAGTRRSCLPTKARRLPLCFASEPSPARNLSLSARLRLRCCAKRMQTVCLSGRHSQELLADKG